LPTLNHDDLNHEIARLLRATMRDVAPDTWLLAEHGHDFSGDVLGDGWHGSMNYSGFTRPVWTWLTSPGHGLPYMGLPTEVPSLSGPAVLGAVRDFAGAVPWRARLHSTTLLGSHDSARIRSVVGGRERHLVALAMLTTFPGVPQVFAGDELGLTGRTGEDSRTPMPWHRPESWDRETLAAYRVWLGLRRRHIALRRGGLRWLHVGADSITYLREHPQERLLVHLARGPRVPVVIPSTVLGLAPGAVPDVLAGEPVSRCAAGPARSTPCACRTTVPRRPCTGCPRRSAGLCARVHDHEGVAVRSCLSRST
jgi:alpha-glucosidase